MKLQSPEGFDEFEEFFAEKMGDAFAERESNLMKTAWLNCQKRELEKGPKLKALQKAVEKTIKKIYPSGGGSFPVTLEELPPMAVAEIPVIKALELVQALRQSKEGK